MADLYRVVNDLIALEVTAGGTLSTEDHERVTDLLRSHGITYYEFRDLDEKPGRWGYRSEEGGWHWKLRQTRNHHRPMFDALWPRGGDGR